jgi:superfamily I DNA and RNA helicase
MTAYFIATEPLEKDGEAGEKLVWDATRAAFADRDCISYWRYPIFSQVGKFRKEPDILIADRELGLIVIEVKSIRIDQLVQISGHRWEYQNYYTAFGNPYQQAENQLFALLDYFRREPCLRDRITARALVALPFVSQQEWQGRGFDRLPSNPPILFQDHFSYSVDLCEYFQKLAPVIQGQKITFKDWKLWLSILSGTPLFCQPTHRVLSPPQSRGKILQKLRSQISDFDLQQEKISKQIPPGCQRIRGIAGSGKTVLLCQKLAHMHLKHPDWKIALVFFSRSLYHPIIEQVDRWLRHFSQNQQGYEPKNLNLCILHAWGSKNQAGLYSTLCKLAGIRPLSVNDTESQPPNEALAEACIHLLKATAIPQIFDAILIDEGQDLIADRWKFDHKQPFYWMAYQALRPVNPIYPEQKRLIWAYDEAQSLETLKIPTASELFGEELGYLVTGTYPGGIKKSEIVRRCYRTPHDIIIAAHAIGMGLLRPAGMLTGMTRADEWKAIGYEVQGKFIAGEKITLNRPRENSANPLQQWWKGSIIDLNTYAYRQQELTALAQKIKHNLRYDGLRPSREILVILVGHVFEAIKLEAHVATFLIKQGIDIFIPGNRHCNCLKTEPEEGDPNRFWHDGAITVARIHRAKGHEADMVYVVGLDRVAKEESNLSLRNQLFVALTRSRAWAEMSGIGNYPLYQEIHQVIQSKETLTFTFSRPPQRQIGITDAGELLTRYARGGRNFKQVDLSHAELAGVYLNQANFIGANLQAANLQQAQLEGTKFIAANLSHANLTGANLRQAKLIGAVLRGTNLMGADLTHADLSDADLTDANLTGTKFSNAQKSII